MPDCALHLGEQELGCGAKGQCEVDGGGVSCEVFQMLQKAAGCAGEGHPDNIKVKTAGQDGGEGRDSALVQERGKSWIGGVDP